jgi:methionyl-tRNA formyltransferase
MQVRTIYDPILRTKCQKVAAFDESLKKETDQMVETMHKAKGIGLAANQVGINKQLIVLEFTPAEDDDQLSIPLTQLCNPVITKFSQEKETHIEGCLSIPGLELEVARSSGVTVTAQDLTGKNLTIRAKGLLARILQHEIDHINGHLFTDRAKDGKSLANYRFAKIIFFGSDEFSQVVFQCLIDAGLTVPAIITESDKPAGRGKKETEPIMKKIALDQSVAVFQPETKADMIDIVKQIKPDLIILASYGRILPAEVLAIPTFGALNIHPSLLPKYRGATPIQSALLDDQKETGVTIMVMDENLDTGAIVNHQTTPIKDNDNYLSLRAKLAELAAKSLLTTLPEYLSGQATLGHQSTENVSLTKKLTKEAGQIDWSNSPEQIDRQIRALNPWPGTYTQLGDRQLKILEAKVINGKLAPTIVQLEGKKPTNWPDFVRGYSGELKKSDWFATIA